MDGEEHNEGGDEENDDPIVASYRGFIDSFKSGMTDDEVVEKQSLAEALIASTGDSETLPQEHLDIIMHLNILLDSPTQFLTSLKLHRGLTVVIPEYFAPQGGSGVSDPRAEFLHKAREKLKEIKESLIKGMNPYSFQGQVQSIMDEAIPYQSQHHPVIQELQHFLENPGVYQEMLMLEHEINLPSQPVPSAHTDDGSNLAYNPIKTAMESNLIQLSINLLSTEPLNSVIELAELVLAQAEVHPDILHEGGVSIVKRFLAEPQRLRVEAIKNAATQAIIGNDVLRLRSLKEPIEVVLQYQELEGSEAFDFLKSLYLKMSSAPHTSEVEHPTSSSSFAEVVANVNKISTKLVSAEPIDSIDFFGNCHIANSIL